MNCSISTNSDSHSDTPPEAEGHRDSPAAADSLEAAWLQEVFERYEGPLVRYVLRQLGNLDAARDVVQDAFVRLCRQPSPRREMDRGVAAWLYTVCRNRALDVRRKENRMSQIDPSQAASCESSEADPAQVALGRDQADCALAALRTLPENQQEVLRLKMEHGLSYREISEVTGLTVSNVGYLLHQGLKTLRLRLADSPGTT